MVSRRTRNAVYAMAITFAFLILLIIVSYVSGKESWNAGFAGTAALPGGGHSDFTGLCIFVAAHKLGPLTLSSSVTGDCVVNQDIYPSSGANFSCVVHASIAGWTMAPGFTGAEDFFVTAATVTVDPTSVASLCLAVFFPAANQSTGMFTGSFDTGIEAAPGHNVIRGVNGFTELQTNVVLYS